MKKYYFALALFFTWIAINSGIEFYAIASRTGDESQLFSFKWAIAFFVCLFYLLVALGVLWGALFKGAFSSLNKNETISILLGKLGVLRYFIIFFIVFLPIYIFQYSFWGLIFDDIHLRVFVWVNLIVFVAILLPEKSQQVLSWRSLLLGTLLSATVFTLASVFSIVSDYPFNLFWSDGNRIWDYSLVFGRDLYNYPADKEIPSLTSEGRQILWGLPFLLPNSSIFLNRFWSAFVLSFPYMVLGWVVFKPKKDRAIDILWVGMWVFLFLNQGPIYTPLVLSAILVAIVWDRPLWIALPGVALAGYYAELTRYTWEFAPAIWAGILSLNGNNLKGERLKLQNWVRAGLLGVAGISLWMLAPFWRRSWGNISAVSQHADDYESALVGTVSNAQSLLSNQTLLWNRLLPNETYPEGILGGLFLAVFPLMILLIHIMKRGYWRPILWQKVVLIGSLAAFLIVGIIISAKIGGGNNLHNLDMFLITLLFMAGIAWNRGGRKWLYRSSETSPALKSVLLLLLIIPAYFHVKSLKPNITLSPNEVQTVKVLANVESVPSLPSKEEVNDVLWYINLSIEQYGQDKGEILLIDLRQLLTFGYVPKIPLVPEYEKKILMNEALSGDATYFATYYQDLANQRFSLIITEPLKLHEKDEGSFSEEGDAWTKWVARPTLCFYEPLETFRDVYVQLLVPRSEHQDCSMYLEP